MKVSNFKMTFFFHLVKNKLFVNVLESTMIKNGFYNSRKVENAKISFLKILDNYITDLR